MSIDGNITLMKVLWIELFYHLINIKLLKHK
jgi:hypothetical protein